MAKLFQCPKCNKRCEKLAHLQEHYRMKHGAEAIVVEATAAEHVCPRCQKEFINGKALQDHEQAKHRVAVRSEKFFAKKKKERARKPRYEKPARIGSVVPCPVHGLTMTSRKGPYGTYRACPLRPECDIIGDWSDHDGRFHVSTQADRDARKLAHAALDPLWQSGYMKRRDAYEMIAAELGIAKENIGRDCHMKHFNEATALLVVSVVKRFVTDTPELHDQLITHNG